MPYTDRRPPTAMPTAASQTPSDPTPALPLFDPRWPLELQRTYTQLAARRINARRGASDPTLTRHLAAFAAAIFPLTSTTRSTHMQPKPAPPLPNSPTPPTPPLALAPSTTLTTPTLTLGTPSPFNAAQWERLTTAARDHAKSQIERATAQRALLATEIAELEQTAAALDRALRAFRQPPAAQRAHGEALRQALEWADTHGGVLDTRLYQRTTGRQALSYSTITRLAARGQLVHVGGPKSGRYQRPAPSEPSTKLADQP